MFPFNEHKDGKYYVRTFSENLTEMDLKWHYDEEDRNVICEQDTDWMFQMDNELPIPIEKGKTIHIPKGEYHRIIKGSGDLTLKVEKLNESEEKILYTAEFVIDVEDLKKRFPPVHPNHFYHHCTIEFRPDNLDGIEVGRKKKLTVIGRVVTDKIDALLIGRSSSSKNKHPHITLSTNKGVKPIESNDEIEWALSENNVKEQNAYVDVIEGYFNGKEDVVNQLNEVMVNNTDLPPFKVRDYKLILNGQEVGKVYLHHRNYDDRDYFDLSEININPEHRDQKIFTRFMNGLIKIMDNENAIISLTPEKMGEGGPSTEELRKIYMKFGFVPNKGENKNFKTQNSLIRYPNNK